MVVGGAVALLSACGSKPLQSAPVEDRGVVVNPPAQTDTRTLPVKQPPGFENAGKPGYYTIKPGDTLIRIGLETGQSHKDLARWNALDNPNRIEVGQVIRVVPPLESTPVVGKPAPAPVVAATPLPPVAATNGSAAKPVGAPAPVASAPAPAKTASAPSAPASAPASAAPAAPAGEEEMAWIWPAQGAVLAGFDESRNKGLDIQGDAGDAVLAAADGKVVYAGSSLRGYGNLVILKHGSTYLTAYAHNRALLVKEDQAVKKGQKIAEMGNTDADRVKLHFELRRQGKPVDPAKYLPAR